MSALLDLVGEVCPFTFVRAKLGLEELALGDELTVIVDHPPAAESVPRSLAAEGHEIVSIERRGETWRIRIVKRTLHRLDGREKEGT